MEDLGWLQKSFASGYGIQVSSAYRVRDAWKLETSQGPKCFKQVKSSAAKVEFTAAAIQHVLTNGFTETVPLLKTLSGTHALQLPQGIFYATDWLPGREGDFTQLKEIATATRALARFHKASQGFKPPLNCEPKETWGLLPKQWLERYQQLLGFKKIAGTRSHDRFSILYLSCCQSLLQRAQQALALLNGCNYSALVENAKKHGSLCHRDYTYHNCLVDNDKLYIIDFDYCTQEIRAYDIGKLIRRVGKYHRYSLDPIKVLLKAYHTQAELHMDEIIFVLAFVHFPQRFWRIANRFYGNSHNSKPEHLIAQLEHEIGLISLEENLLGQLSAEVYGGGLLGR